MTVTSGYADAWNTHGWTAQWGYLPNDTPTSPNLFDITTLPVGLKALAVTGTWRDQWGSAWGNLHFSPSVNYIQIPSGAVNLTDFRVYLQNGSLPSNFILPMPDSAVSGVNPQSFSWKVTGRIGSVNALWVITVPTAGPYDLSAFPFSPADPSIEDGGSAASDSIDGGGA